MEEALSDYVIVKVHKHKMYKAKPILTRWGCDGRKITGCKAKDGPYFSGG